MDKWMAVRLPFQLFNMQGQMALQLKSHDDKQ